MSQTATIIIADDHVIYRTGLREILINAGYQVVAIAGNGFQLIEACAQYQPHIVFIDIRMPGMNGIEACRQLTARFPHIVKIAITFHERCHADIHKMWEAGATGFLSKQSDQDEIIRCVNTVYNGGIHCDENCRVALRDELDHDPLHHLAAPEQQLMLLIADEKTSNQIAALVHQSPHNIEKRRKKLYEKCGVTSTVGLIKFGVKRRFLNHEDW
ncbi:MAG: response regulator [Flavisolibacter sp.]